MSQSQSQSVDVEANGRPRDPNSGGRCRTLLALALALFTRRNFGPDPFCARSSVFRPSSLTNNTGVTTSTISST